MKGFRLAGAAVFCVWIAAHIGSPAAFGAPLDDAVVRSGDEAPLFRVFLKDGSSLVSYGELARVADRVVFSMPTAASVDNPELHLVDISSDRVDWERTANYAESARAVVLLIWASTLSPPGMRGLALPPRLRQRGLSRTR